MRLIDADKLYPDRMTKEGVAISQSQIANAPTINVIEDIDVLEAIQTLLVAYGIPLPKGHGDLIDRNELLGKVHGIKSVIAVSDAPTIIPADKESAE